MYKHVVHKGTRLASGFSFATLVPEHNAVRSSEVLEREMLQPRF